MKEPLKGLRAGPHILRLSKEGFADVHQFVDVVYNRTSTLDVDVSTNAVAGVLVEAESKAGHGSIFLVSAEPGIEIRIDGEPAGSTPLGEPIKGIPAGTHRISLRQEGMEPFVQEFVVVAGQRTDIAIDRQGSTLNAAVFQTVAANAQLPTVEQIRAEAAIDRAARQRHRPPPGEPTWKRTAGLSALGAGVAAFGAATYFGIRVAALQTDATATVKGLWLDDQGVYRCDRLTLEECEARHRQLFNIQKRAKTNETLEWIGLGGGTGLVLAGSMLLAWEWYQTGLFGFSPLREPGPGEVPMNEAPPLTLRPSASPLPEGGVAFVLLGQF